MREHVITRLNEYIRTLTTVENPFSINHSHWNTGNTLRSRLITHVVDFSFKLVRPEECKRLRIRQQSKLQYQK